MAAWLASLTAWPRAPALGLQAVDSASTGALAAGPADEQGAGPSLPAAAPRQAACDQVHRCAKPPRLGERLPARLQGPLRSGSLSARMATCASRGHQALQVAENGAGLGARLLVLLEQLLQALRWSARRWCPAGAGSALPLFTPGRSLKAFRSLPSRNTASGLTPPWSGTRWRSCRCAASASPLAHRRQLGRRVLLQLQRGHGLGVSSRSDDWRLIGRERLAHLRQRSSAGPSHRGVLLARSTSGGLVHRPAAAAAAMSSRRS